MGGVCHLIVFSNDSPLGVPIFVLRAIGNYMKCTEQYFLVLLESVKNILRCDHSNENY